MKKVIVIGAGLGGLSAAIRLAKSGFAVTILEKNENVGGKVNFVEANGYKFDTGASLLTMRHVFEDLFEFVRKTTLKIISTSFRSTRFAVISGRTTTVLTLRAICRKPKTKLRKLERAGR